MTLAEIKQSEASMLTCQDIAEVIGAKPFNIHCQAIDAPERLGFRVTVIGKRVLIPRLAFLKYLGEEVANGKT